MIKTLKANAEYRKVGMIASHLGVVRGSSREGHKVKGIEVKYDRDAIDNIIEDIKRLNGIVEVLVEINEGYLKVGDDILAVAVAGDIRENVFPALIKAVNRIKADASRKKEIYG
ncbi:MAG: molybdenum cofactor biosynthesis protein MoaE [Pseudomonadota bacterium]